MIPSAPRLSATLALLLVAACATRPPVRPPVPAGEAVSRLAQEAAGRKSLRGLARVRIEGRGQAGSASQVVLVTLPDKARLETQSAVGTAAVVVVLQGDELRVQNFLRHEYLLGRATQENLARLAGVAVPPGAMLRLLLGLPPLPVRTGDPRLHQVPVEDGVRIETVDERMWQRLRLDGTGRLVEGELGEGETALVRVHFEDYRPLDVGEFPFTIDVEQADGAARLRLRYETVTLNVELAPTLFALPPPQDDQTRVLPLDGAAR